MLDIFEQKFEIGEIFSKKTANAEKVQLQGSFSALIECFKALESPLMIIFPMLKAQKPLKTNSLLLAMRE